MLMFRLRLIIVKAVVEVEVEVDIDFNIKSRNVCMYVCMFPLFKQPNKQSTQKQRAKQFITLEQKRYDEQKLTIKTHILHKHAKYKIGWHLVLLMCLMFGCFREWDVERAGV